MAELYYDEEKSSAVYRQGLRSPYIDYCNGWLKTEVCDLLKRIGVRFTLH